MLRRRCTLARTLPATLEAVDSFCVELRSGVLAGVPANERFTIELLLRETLTNAVVHGGHRAAAGEVRCDIDRFRGGITFHISDPGDGFDWRGRLHASAPPRSESGRGLEILRHYSSELEFNAEGNTVKVTRMFDEGDENG